MRRLLPLVLALALAGCGGTSPEDAAESPSATPTTSAAPTPTPTPSPTPTTTAPKPSPSPTTEKPDPRWRFYVADRTRYASPWYAGRHRLMIGFGCTPAPWYDHDTRCPGRQGFHHGIDVAMPCGTQLYSGVDGVVLAPTAPGAPGAAYGQNPFRIHAGAYDVLIGHSRPPVVHPGQHVRKGQPIALSSDSGAPDGCHLHFEVRRHGGGLSAAVEPNRWLALRP